MTKLIIDTDIGSDVDDALALVHAIKSGIEIPLITTVHGPTTLRAGIARHITRLLEQDIPVVAGYSKPLLQKQLFLTGNEGKHLQEDTKDIPDNVIEALASTIHTHKGNIDIAAIGPLTNLAKTFQAHPELPDMINHLYIMGNLHLTPNNQHYFLNYRTHNFKVDPEAADIVFATSTPKTIITTAQGKQHYLTRDDLERLNQQDPLEHYLYQAAHDHLHFMESDKVYLYDPLTIHHHLTTLTSTPLPNNIHVSNNHTTFTDDFKKTLLRRNEP